MFKRLIALGLGVGAVLTALPAHAEANTGSCAPREDLVARLESEYSERLTAAGMQESTLIEVWSSTETGTFTVIHTDSLGNACILATGTDWYADDTDQAHAEAAHEPIPTGQSL